MLIRQWHIDLEVGMMEIWPEAYLLGRDICRYPCEGDPIEDRLFAAQRLDGSKVIDKRFHHCTFSNVSFKDVELTHCEFLDCAFIGCYFRKSQIRDCRFPGSKFYGCQFPRVSVQSCDFRYASFGGCVIPYSEMEDNLPSELNLRQELTAILAHASEMLGLTKEARNYRLQSIKAQESHLWAAVRSASSWYQNHYQGVRRWTALISFLASKLNGLLWGYGERWVVLLRNLILLTFVFFPLLLLLSRDGLSVQGQFNVSISDIMWLSIRTILPGISAFDVVAISNTTKAILTAEVFSGIVIAGLFVTFLFRSIVRR